MWREAAAPCCDVEGGARALLTGERTALNFLAHLSGVATTAARAARAVEGTGAQVLDTRKTTPGLRALEKAAVAAGGARNHRAGPLRRDPDQGEPHRRGGRDRAAVERARAAAPELAGRSRSRCATPRRSTRRSPPARRGCCSTTWTPTQLRAAVAQVAGARELEASGGVTLETLRAVAETGVDLISMGALTHSAPALDLSLHVEVSP